MIFDVELLNLILYCVQQFGIALGLGAQTILLVAYANAMRDNVIDEEEAQFLRATRSVLWVSLVLIVASGAIITVFHMLAGQADIIMMPAYLFKFALIGAVVLLTALLHTLPETFAEGLLGGTWYALFVVHILAPITTWANLLTLLVVWLIGFNLIWYVIAFSMRKGVVKKAAAVNQPRTPFFSFMRKKVAVDASSKPASEVPVSAPAAPPAPQGTAQFQPIKLDPVPKTQPVTATEALKQMEVTIPIAPKAPAALPQIKTDAVPHVVQQSSLPVEKAPAGIMTDTPFLPQVPPLQPIPVIVPATSSALAPAPAAGIPKANGQPPVLQKPKDLAQTPPPVPPEIKLGLNVMPKSPDQLKQ